MDKFYFLQEISTHQATKASETLLVIDQLMYQMHDNSLYEGGNSGRLNSRVKKVIDNLSISQHEQNLDTIFSLCLSDIDECSKQENSLPDARNNVKLSMMEENVIT